MARVIAEIYDALRSAGADEAKARAAATALAENDERLADAKAELKADIAATRAELKGEIAAAKAELREEIAAVRAELKADIAGARGEVAQLRVEIHFHRWVFGAMLAMQVAILLRLFWPV
jgi:chromosome segregation ATPase